MPQRDYDSMPASDRLDLASIICGLAEDLAAMRARKISAQDGLARAAVAKQLFNGVRLYLQAETIHAVSARPVTAIEESLHD